MIRVSGKPKRAGRIWSAALVITLLLLGWRPLIAQESTSTPKARDAVSSKKKNDPSAKKKKGGASAKKKKKAVPESDQPEEDKQSSRGVRFLMHGYPSLRFGKVARVDFRAKVQTDFRTYSPELQTKEGLFDMHRVRVGVEGRFLKYFEYEVEREIRDIFRQLYEDVDEDRETKNPWRDAYVNFRYFRRVQIQGGKFKVPFGREQLTGPSKLDFIYRSRINDQLAPGRDIGIMAHGRFFERGLSYQAGYFRNDGENAHNKQNEPTGEHAFAARVTGTPLRLLPVPELVKDLEFGAAFVTSNIPEGRNSLRGRTFSKATFFPFKGQRMPVNGQRLRIGTDMSWTPGPFSLKGEFMHSRDERLGQSFRGMDLPDLIARGWYLTGTWAITGERKSGGIEPRKEFLRGWGFGAVELAVRYEQLRFGGSEHPGTPSRSSRAPNILGNSDRAWTFGVNWYLNRWVKVQHNAIHEKIEDMERTPLPNHDRFWAWVWRLQFVM